MKTRRQLGFSLTELLIVVALIAVLAGIAWPSYKNSVQKTRRADGKEALLSAAAMQEKIFLQRNRYSGDISELGGNASKDGHYTISVTQSGGNTTYLLTATATGVQTSDSDCSTFTVNHIGLQKAYDSGSSENPDCW